MLSPFYVVGSQSAVCETNRHTGALDGLRHWLQFLRHLSHSQSDKEKEKEKERAIELPYSPAEEECEEQRGEELFVRVGHNDPACEDIVDDFVLPCGRCWRVATTRRF